MNRNRLDIRDKMPSGMEEYLSQNGWHFNKKLCEWAISNMWKLNSDGKKEHISITPKEEIKQQFKNYGITVDNCVGYDGLPMTRFYADCIGKGTPIMWEDMI